MALFSNQLSVIRQYVSSAVGDLILSTAGTPLSTTLYTDSTLLKADDYYNNKHYRAYCYNGTAKGQEREVYDWVFANRNLIFTPPFSPTIADGDTFELHHIFTEGDYRRAINLAIEALAGKYLVNIIDDTTIGDGTTMTATLWEYALPTSLLYLTKVTEEHEVGGDEFYNEDVIDSRNWSIIKAFPPMLKLDKRYYTPTAGKTLRLEGQGTQPIVTGDTDVIYLPPDWLVQKAITFLPQNRIQSNDLDATYRQAMILSSVMPRNWPDPRAQRIVE